MQLIHITIQSTHLEKQRDFYTQTLGFTLHESHADSFTLNIGSSLLTLQQATDQHIHHIAINIPPQQFESALTWTEARVPLMPHDGKKFVDFSKSKWEARSLYFEDVAGNVMEFIARERAPMPDAPNEFGIEQVMSISEVGLASEDVPELVAALKSTYNFPTFDGNPETGFCALGDHDGLLICVETGRNWLPTDNRPSGLYPVTLEIAGCDTGTHTFAEDTYTVSCRPTANDE